MYMTNINIKKKLLIKAGPNSKLVRDYKNSLTNLNSKQSEASIGLMLGDASLQTQNGGKSYRLKFEWGEKNKAYLDHVYNLFDDWVLSSPHRKERINSNGNLVVNWGFQTISHKAFNYLQELFLSNNKKGISKSLVKNYLTPIGLAYWFMDDGGKLDYNKNSKNKSVVLNTHSFSDLEVEDMANDLSNKFNFSCDIRSNKGKKIIIINSISYPIFIDLIDPYIIPEMRNKLP
jgi:hypothetical protein